MHLPTGIVLALLVGVAAGGSAAEARQASPEAAMIEARRSFDALEYERALPALSALIDTLAAANPAEGPARLLLAEALELRARARYATGDREGARADFVALLGTAPDYRLSGQVSPRVIALFEEVRKAAVAHLVLSLEPMDAEARVNGRAVPAGEPVALAGGSHVVEVRRPGYRPSTQTIQLEPGATRELAVALERVWATLSVVTVPPGIEVTVDGVSKGTTLPGAGRPAAARWAEQLNVSPAQVSDTLLIADLPVGLHTLSLAGRCFEPYEQRVTIEKATDYRLDPIRLKPAVGSITISGDVAGAVVLLDGEPKGTAPMTLADVCEGPRLVELRTAHGLSLIHI